MRRCLSILLFFIVVPAYATPLEFHLTYEGKEVPQSFTGRVHILLSKGKMGGPPVGPNWFRPEPMLARDVRDWKPVEKLVIGGDALAFPGSLAKLEKGTYWVLAVMDLDQGHRSFAAAPGNIFSQPQR